LAQRTEVSVDLVQDLLRQDVGHKTGDLLQGQVHCHTELRRIGHRSQMLAQHPLGLGIVQDIPQYAAHRQRSGSRNIWPFGIPRLGRYAQFERATQPDVSRRMSDQDLKGTAFSHPPLPEVVIKRQRVRPRGQRHRARLARLQRHLGKPL